MLKPTLGPMNPMGLAGSSLTPLTEGYVRKGGRNSLQDLVGLERPSPPAAMFATKAASGVVMDAGHVATGVTSAGVMAGVNRVYTTTPTHESLDPQQAGLFGVAGSEVVVVGSVTSLPQESSNYVTSTNDPAFGTFATIANPGFWPQIKWPFGSAR